MDKVSEHLFSRREFLKVSAATFAAALLERKMPRAGSRVEFREDRIALVNGSSFFPLGIFYLSEHVKETDVWTDVAQAKFNTVAAWWIDETRLRSAEQNGLKTVAYVNYAFPNFEKTGEIDPDRLKIIKESPSILAWYGPDEPRPGNIDTLQVEATKQIARLDPNHPMWINYLLYPDDMENAFGLDEFRSTTNGRMGASITGFDVGWAAETAGDYHTYADQLIRYRRNLVKGAVKALWVILSAHSEIPWTKKGLWNKAIEAISNGATGIYWWDWPPGCTTDGCPTYPGKGDGYHSHWDKLKSIAGVLDTLKPGLIGKEKRLVTNDNYSMKVTTNGLDTYFFISTKAFSDERKRNGNVNGYEIDTGLPAGTILETFDEGGEKERLVVGEEGKVSVNLAFLTGVALVHRRDRSNISRSDFIKLRWR